MRCRKSRDESRLSRLIARATKSESLPRRGAGCQACRAEIRLGFFFRAVALLTLLLPVAWSATSTAWETTGYNDFLKGSLRGLELTADGIVRPGPAVKGTSVVDQPALWAAVLAPDGSVYLGTGHRGKVYRVASGGAVTLVWTAPQPEVFALCIGKDGALYAGTSPSGSIYRIENGKATELFHPPAKYIWALAAAPQGGLYAATGDQGRIYYISASGKGDVYYETGQQHVTSLAVGPQDDLYAGSDPGGLLFQIAAQGKGTILFHSPLPEVHGLAIEADGTVYASALGGSLTTRNASQAAASATGSTAVVSESPTVVSVTAEEAAAPAQVGDLKPGSERGTATSTITPLTAATTATTAEVSGVDKSAIYRINPDHSVETLRTSKDDNVFDLLLNGTKLLFFDRPAGTPVRARARSQGDAGGRIGRFRGSEVDPERHGIVCGSKRTRQAHQLVARSAGRSFAGSVRIGRARCRLSRALGTSRMAGAGRIDCRPHANGQFTAARWNLERLVGSLIQMPRIPIKSPTARYIQWRAEWQAGTQPSSESSRRLVSAAEYAARYSQHQCDGAECCGRGESIEYQAASSSAFSVTVTDSPAIRRAGTSSSGAQTVSRLNSTQTQITWQADDAGRRQARLRSDFRGEDEKEWKLIRSQIFDYSLLLDPDVLADGRY